MGYKDLCDGLPLPSMFFLFPVSDSQNDLQDLTLSTVSLVVLESVDRERGGQG